MDGKRLGIFVAHQLPPRSYGSSKETGMTRRCFPECVYVEVPRVTFSLAMSLVDSFFEMNATCHFLIGCVVLYAQVNFLINRGIPPLPSAFLKFSFFDIPRLEPCLGISSRP